MTISIDLIQKALPDRYQLEKKLAEKPDRQTWLAHDDLHNERVVLKIVWFLGPSVWQNRTYFEREVQFLQQISHSAIPKFIDDFDLQVDHNHGFVLVQQYIPARSMTEHRESGRVFSEVDIHQIIEQVLEILIYLHSQEPPILHRDIKPSNLLLGDRSAHRVGQIYLVDFGVANSVTESIGKTLTVVGSYGYAPIEQFGGRAVPTSDLYSLGATVIYLLTGRHPAELPQVDLKIQFESATNVSIDLKNWLIKATEPFLDRRFPNAIEALESLRNPVTTNFPGKISYPVGTRITCDRFDTFLRIQQPIINPHIGTETVLRNSIFRFVVNILIVIVSFPICVITTFGIGTSLGFPILWQLPILMVMVIGVPSYIIGRLNKTHTKKLSQLVHQEYHINENEIRREQWFLSKKSPDAIGLLRSDLKQIDRISAHRTGREVNTEDGTTMVWTDVASKIELRTEKKTFTLENLREPEVDWLCAELSDYLEIPVVVHTVGE